jgi:hypothetical protein
VDLDAACLRQKDNNLAIAGFFSMSVTFVCFVNIKLSCLTRRVTPFTFVKSRSELLENGLFSLYEDILALYWASVLSHILFRFKF